MWTKKFWRDAAERAAKTGAQALAALFVTGVTILTIDWGQAAAVTGTMMMMSVLTSVMSAGVGSNTTAAALPVAGGRHRRP